MLNLDAINDDRKVGVLCKMLSQVEILIDAVQVQRPDINVGDWPKDLKEATHANRAYYLNYRGNRRLQHGRPDAMRDIGLSYLQFEELWVENLPDIEGNKTGILSLLGVE